MGKKMKIFRKMHNQKGFTLIEVMIAMVILGFGLLAVGSLQTRNMAYNSTSKRQTEGYNWAMDKIERLLTQPYDGTGDLAVQGSPTVVGDGHSPNAADTALLVPYTVEWDVVDNVANIPNSSQVFVFVRLNGTEVATVDFIRTELSF